MTSASGRKLLTIMAAIAWCSFAAAVTAQTRSPAPASAAKPEWIWTPQHGAANAPQGSCYFRKTIELATEPAKGFLEIAADDVYELFVNGKRIATGSTQSKMDRYNVVKYLREGTNVIAVKVTNRNGQHAGLAARLEVVGRDNASRSYVTNATWKSSLKALPLWTSVAYLDERWEASRSLGTFGNTEPWSQPPKRRGLLSVVPKKSSDGETTRAPDGEHPKFRLPEGFQVQHVVGGEKTGSLIAMAFNEFGQILASQEGGPLLLVYDTNKNDTPDEVRVCCDRVRNCQGILPINGQVYVIADGPMGAALYRLSDEDQDGNYENVESVVRFKGSMSEHGPHGLALGPDAMIYIVTGNYAELEAAPAETSPYRNGYEGDLATPRYEDPRGHAAGIKAPGGTVLRTDLEGQRVEVFAGGLRNVYDLAFNHAGDLFAYDSDMEADAGTPWHRPTRILHVTPGSEFGWRSGWAVWPEYLVDSLPPILNTDRGSPTGCVFYNHHVYPARYHHVMFSCDWAQGEIHAIRMEPRGSSYTARREIFLQGTPLNVTDIDVGPDGWIYFTTGGRGTQGNMYRVAWTGKATPYRDSTGVASALRHDQPQSAWGRQGISTAREKYAAEWNEKVAEFVFNKSQTSLDRVQALGLMHLVGPPPTDAQLAELTKEKDPLLRARAAYFLGMIPNEVAINRLIEMLDDPSPYVRRVTCESLGRSQTQVPIAVLSRMLSSGDRWEAWSARRLLEHNPDREWYGAVLSTDRLQLFVQGSLAILIRDPEAEACRQIVQRAVVLAQGFAPDRDMLDVIRIVQLAMLRGNLAATDVPELKSWLSQKFPAKSDLVNRELVRVIVHAQLAEFTGRLVEYLKSTIPEVERVHVATQLRFMKEGWTPALRADVLQFMERARTLDGGKNLAAYMDKVSIDFTQSLDIASHDMVMARADQMPHMAVTSLFALPESEDAQLVPRLIELDRRLVGKKDEQYDELRVAIVAILARHGSEDAMGYLREIYDRDPERRKIVAMGLAQKPDGRNWDYLVRSIPILDGEPAREALAKLTDVGFAPEQPEHIRQVILCGLRLKENGGMLAAKLLEHWMGITPPGAGQQWDTALAAWQRWYDATYPAQPSANLPKESGQNTYTYDDLLTFLDSAQGKSGSAQRGADVFRAAQCANCHRFGAEGSDNGPDLTTIAKRFQKREVLESIVHPSQVISDQYATRTVLTEDGGTYAGVVMPGEEHELNLLQSDGKILRLERSNVEEILPNRVSSMPEGLLNSLTLDQIADLFAYLMATPDLEVATRP